MVCVQHEDKLWEHVGTGAVSQVCAISLHHNAIQLHYMPLYYYINIGGMLENFAGLRLDWHCNCPMEGLRITSITGALQ